MKTRTSDSLAENYIYIKKLLQTKSASEVKEKILE